MNEDNRQEMDNEANDALFGMEEQKSEEEEELDLPVKAAKKKSKKKAKNLDDILNEGANEENDLADELGDMDLRGKKKKRKDNIIVSFPDALEAPSEKTKRELAEIQSERPWLDRD